MAALTIPPFGGDDVLGQLNAWAATVVTKLDQLSTGLAEANGRSLLLQTEVDAKTVEVADNLRQVTTAGAGALNAVIDGFRIELGKHEYAHGLARSQIEAVIAGAELKFREIEEAAKKDANSLYDGFKMECERRGAADAHLRTELQVKFAAVEGMLTRTSSSGAAPVGAAPVDDMTDDWARAWERRQSNLATASPSPPWAGSVPTPPTTPAPNYAPETVLGAAPPRFSIFNRDWGDNRRLDLVAAPEAFVTWRDRALGHLAKCRPDVRRMLIWAEKQTAPIDEMGEKAGAAETGVTDNPHEVSYVLFEGIKHLIADSLLCRARLCGDGRGLEL
jgi:hypothetical protein